MAGLSETNRRYCVPQSKRYQPASSRLHRRRSRSANDYSCTDTSRRLRQDPTQRILRLPTNSSVVGEWEVRRQGTTVVVVVVVLAVVVRRRL